jgi:cytochrome b561
MSRSCARDTGAGRIRHLNVSAASYGWISIVLHWLTAILILYLLYLGSTIGSLEGADRDLALGRHTSVAITSYLLLLGRIVWRFVVGHPGPTEGQAGWAFTLGKYTHYVILVALLGMLVSGPLMQFSYGRDIVVFDWFTIPTPMDPSFGLAGFLRNVHTSCAIVIFLGVVLHIGGVYKHTAFNQDGTLAKIIIPRRQSVQAAQAAAVEQSRAAEPAARPEQNRGES